jgi:acyl-CoA synthetase (AMP-forming)/AMP-acid ligase II
LNPAQVFIDGCDAHPDRKAIVELGGRSISYGNLGLGVHSFAAICRARGIAPGDRVLVQVPPGIDLTVVLLGLMWVGAVPLLLEPGLGDSVYLSRVQMAQPHWLVVHRKLLWVHRIPGLKGLLSRFGVDLPPLPGASDLSRIVVHASALQKAPNEPIPCVERKPGDDALIVFTGGTTQAPKCVRMGVAAIGHYLDTILEVLDHMQSEAFLADTPPQVLYALRRGQTAFVNKGRKQTRPRRVSRLVRAGAVDACFSSPYIWMEMMANERPWVALPTSLRTILLGSAPTTRDFLWRLLEHIPPSTEVLLLYGMTEVGIISQLDARVKVAWTGDGDLVGSVLEGIDVQLHGAESAAGVGEVMVRSASLFSGYLGAPTRGENEALATGDLGQWVWVDGQKMLALVGRKKDMIIRKSVNIYPLSYESHIKETVCDGAGRPLLADCAMVGVWNGQRQDEDLVLFAVLVPDAKGSADWLAEQVGPLCGTEAKPDHCFLVDRFPVKGRQNKIDKAALRLQAERLLGAKGAQIDPESPAPLAFPRLIVPFRWGAFRAKHRVLRREGGWSAAWRPMALHSGLWAVNQVGWAADTVLCPRVHRAPTPDCLFILGHQRSGTTFLHRLLNQDPTAHSLALHEMLLPATSIQRLIGLFTALDACIGSPAQKGFDRLQNRRLGHLDPIHRVRLNEPEEDEFVLWAIFASDMCINDNPVLIARADPDMPRAFADWTPEEQGRAISWYRACVVKKMNRVVKKTAREKGGLYVGKNPRFTRCIPLLNQSFPDSRMVLLVRNPLDAIPSRMSLLRALWRIRKPGFNELLPAHVEWILQDSIETYLKAERDFEGVAPDRRIVVGYRALKQDPAGTVGQILEQFSLPAPSGELQSTLQGLASQIYQSTHQYDLAEFGLTEAQIRGPLAAVFDRHQALFSSSH